MQDNGPAEFGFILGYNKTELLLRRCHEGDEEAHLPERQDQIRARQVVSRRGSLRRQADAAVSSMANSTPPAVNSIGPVLYANSAPFVIGRYRDDDEDYPMHGAIKEVMLCPHAVARMQVAAHFEADQAPRRRSRRSIPAGPRFVVEPYLQYRDADTDDRDVGDGDTLHRGRRIRQDVPSATGRESREARRDGRGRSSPTSSRGRSTSTASSAPMPAGRKAGRQAAHLHDRDRARRSVQLHGHRRHAAEPGGHREGRETDVGAAAELRRPLRRRGG